VIGRLVEELIERICDIIITRHYDYKEPALGVLHKVCVSKLTTAVQAVIDELP